MTIAEALKKGEESLHPHSDTAYLDAEVLLAYVVGKSRSYLYAHPEQHLTTEQTEKFQQLIVRRQKNEPVAYIVGHKEFWSLDLIVNKDVLIPRPETELLVELTLKLFPEDSKIKVADLGLGSGALAIALAHERPLWTIYGTENYPKALDVALQNAKKFGLSNIHFSEAEWCQGLPKAAFQVIVSNPPYISEDDSALENLKDEPREALAAGKDGLREIRKIVPEAREHLSPEGWLLLEHGYDQSEAVQDLFRQAGYVSISDVRDLAGLPRVVMGKSPR